MSNYHPEKQFYFDFDGTLATNGKVTKETIELLHSLEKEKFLRVIVTGRSLYSFQKAVDENFPIDYLIFSSGAGILNWKNKALIYSKNLNEQDIHKIEKLLQAENLSFMLHAKIPENHHFSIERGQKKVADFYRRIHIYKNFIKERDDIQQSAAQFLAITDENPEHYENIKEKLPEYSVIRATSPLDNKSIWIEIFPKTVSKGKSADFLAKQLGFSSQSAYAFGNDFNDLALLNWAKHSYIVETASIELKTKFQVIQSPEKNGIVLLFQQLAKESTSKTD
jgi:Cof subfamily protein (haloacid dehalogenase superfamily)